MGTSCKALQTPLFPIYVMYKEEKCKMGKKLSQKKETMLKTLLQKKFGSRETTASFTFHPALVM